MEKMTFAAMAFTEIELVRDAIMITQKDGPSSNDHHCVLVEQERLPVFIKYLSQCLAELQAQSEE